MHVRGGSRGSNTRLYRVEGVRVRVRVHVAPLGNAYRSTHHDGILLLLTHLLSDFKVVAHINKQDNGVLYLPDPTCRTLTMRKDRQCQEIEDNSVISQPSTGSC